MHELHEHESIIAICALAAIFSAPHTTSTVSVFDTVPVQHLQSCIIPRFTEACPFNTSMGVLVLFPQPPEQYLIKIGSVVIQSPLSRTLKSVRNVQVAVKSIIYMLVNTWS